jgi:hypothetical protein
MVGELSTKLCLKSGQKDWGVAYVVQSLPNKLKPWVQHPPVLPKKKAEDLNSLQEDLSHMK